MLRSRIVSVCAAMGIAGAAALAAADEARVVLLHTTDLHGALADTDPLAGSSTGRGLSRLATAIRAARAEGAPTLLVDAGDCLEGGIEDAFRLGGSRGLHPMVAAMNALGYDAMVAGNHEFDFGWPALERARRQARFPFLGANVLDAKRGRPALLPSVVRRAGPLTIGIVGVSTPATPRFLPAARTARLRFDDPVARARAEVQRLRRDAGCDAVVLVAHTGLEPESGPDPAGEHWGRRLASQVPGVDVVVLGHSHEVIPALEIEGALLTQAGKRGEALGRVDLAFERSGPDAPWRLTRRRAAIVRADSLRPDPAIEAIARPHLAAAEALLSREAGTTPVAIEAPDGRRRPGSAWELIHRAQLWATGADVSLATVPDPTVRVGAGAVTRRDVRILYPYANELELVELTGAELRAALEHGASSLAEHRFDGASEAPPGPGFDSVHGLEYAVDRTRPAGQRIVGLSWRGTPLAGTQTLRVAVNAYRANGGGGFEGLRGAPRGRVIVPAALRGRKEPLTVRDAIEGYLATGAWDGAISSDWSLLPDFAAIPEAPLLDRLVRHGVLERDSALHLRPGAPAAMDDLDRWIERAFGARPRGAVRAGDLDAAEAGRRITEVAASVLGLADPLDRAAFERSLVTGTSIPGSADVLAAANGGGGTSGRRAVTRGQALGMVSNARFPTIRVLETTDFHGAILPGARDRRTQRPVGGSAVLAAWIERLRGENPEGTVLVDGGDIYQGTMISNLQFGRPVIEQMNALGYAAMAIGNHEFDWSTDTLVARIREMNFAALGANIRERRTGAIPWWARADTTVTRRGVRVGILGLSYRNTPAVTLAQHVAHLEFLDDSVTAVQVVPRLRRRADIVIGIGHVPCVSDTARQALQGDLYRLARGVPGVSAWFGGHSHNPVCDHVGNAPVAIGGSHGQFVVVCDLVVDARRDTVLESRVRLQETWADSIAPDPAMAARVARWNESVAPIASQPLGTSARRLGRYRSGESALGNFVTDAIRAASNADVAMQNSGGLRADLPEGPVTRGTIYEVMPFDNRVFLLGLTGAEVKLAIEQALRSQRVTQVSGIRYAFDLGRPPLDRVVELTDGEGVPLDPARVYRVAVNDFMATGGDEYDVLTGGRNRKETDLTVREVLEDYVRTLTRAGKPVDSKVESRIRRVGETRPVREN